MKHFAIFILMIFGCMHVNAQQSADMKELMEIIEMQKKIKSSPDKNDIYDGIWIRKGQSPYGEIVYTIDEKWIRKGQSPYGEIVYTIDGKWIRKGQSPYGEILYTIDKKWIRKGQSPYGEIMFTIEK